MRILVVTAMYPRVCSDVQGIVVGRSVDALRESGHDVTVVSKDGGARAYVAQLRQTRRLLAGSSFDVVQAHYGTSGLVAAGASSGVPLVTTLHGSDVTYVREPRHGKYFLQGVGTIAGGVRATAILVQASFMRGLLPGFLRGRTTVLEEPVDDRFRRLVPRGPGSGVAFLADARRPGKRFDLAVSAVRLIDDAIPIRSLNDVTPDEIPDLLVSARVGLLTSDREGVPVAVKEAVVAGLPVVAVDLPGVRDIARAVPGSLTVVAPTPEAIAEGLRQALSRPMPTVPVGLWSRSDHTRALIQVLEGAVTASARNSDHAVHD